MGLQEKVFLTYCKWNMDKFIEETTKNAVEVINVSKSFQIYQNPVDRLKQFIYPKVQKFFNFSQKNFFDENWILKRVNFTIKEGESVGIIGKNGVGKSTLLQLICGTLQPSNGEINTFGKITALLELGAGFNPEFTGIENIKLSASLFRIDKVDLEEKIKKIIDFADIGDYINQPVKTYSSGMYVRLAFSVIAFSNPDILIIDEALSVGDIFFQQKCIRFIREFKDKGGTIIFVSHDITAVQNICNKAILLQKNSSPLIGNTDYICKKYLEDLYSDRIGKLLNTFQSDHTNYEKKFECELTNYAKYVISKFNHKADSFGEGKAKIINSYFMDDNRKIVNLTKEGQILELVIEAEIKEKINLPTFGFMLKNRQGEFIFTEDSREISKKDNLICESGSVLKAKFSWKMPTLLPGKWSINVAISEGFEPETHVQQHWIHDALIVDCISSRTIHGWASIECQKISIEV